MLGALTSDAKWLDISRACNNTAFSFSSGGISRKFRALCIMGALNRDDTAPFAYKQDLVVARPGSYPSKPCFFFLSYTTLMNVMY